ncbi:MAG: glycosyltransferase [Anaerolineae bacterium]|nr:glycosyltransferase [Anaerolineae bacterium]
MRILYFTRDYTPHDFRFLSSLAQTDHKIFALRLERKNVQKEDRALPPEITQVLWKGGKHQVNLLDGPALLFDLQRIIRKIKPDIIHAGSIQTGAFLTALSGYNALVSMSWGSDLLVDSDRNPWWNWATRFTLSRTKVLLGDCLAVKEKAASLGLDAQRVVLFPWGVDLSQFSPGPAGNLINRLGWQDKFVLLSLRSWEPLYGIDVLIKAFGRAALENDQLRLILLGGGSLAPMVQSMIHEYQLIDRIYLGGQVKQADLPGYYRSADLYLSASHSDGSSVSLMEALACGKPVLVSDIPGNKEWVTPGEEGWLFEDGHVDSLKTGILNAFREKNQLPLMGLRSRQLAEARADWQKNFVKLLEAYQMVKGNL